MDSHWSSESLDHMDHSMQMVMKVAAVLNATDRL
jgi:hypothetical protein